ESSKKNNKKHGKSSKNSPPDSGSDLSDTDKSRKFSIPEFSQNVPINATHILKEHKIPLFYGDDDEEDPTEWLQDLIKVCKVNNWNETTIVRQIPLALKGVAACWYEEFPDRIMNDLKQFANVFIRQFTNEATTAKLHARIVSLRKKPDESITKYYGKFTKLLRRADPDDEYYLTKQRSDLFIRGLDKKLQRKVFSTRINTLAKAYKKAKEAETMLTYNDFTTSVNAVLDDETENADGRRIKRLEKIIQTLVAEQRENRRIERPTDDEKKCHYCGRKGHLMRECRTRLFDQRKEQFTNRNRSFDAYSTPRYDQ
ncbi:5490_t:CDS:1, partial [Ambispora gerdemannii]